MINIMSSIYSALIFIFSLLILSCNINYSKPEVNNENNEIPDTVLNNMKYTVVKNGTVVIEITSEKTLNYNETQKTVLTNIIFKQFDENGVVKNSGKADYSIYEHSTENAKVSGGIELQSESQGTSLSTDSLYWNKYDRKIISNSDQKVRITRNDGSSVEGSGFSADFSTKTITFESKVSGFLWY